MNIVKLFFLLFLLFTNGEKVLGYVEEYINCNDADMDNFELEIPKPCAVNLNQSWHLEIQTVIKHNVHSDHCTHQLRVLFVSPNYVILLHPSLIPEEHVLLTYSTQRNFNYPSCLSKSKQYYKFNEGYYIPVIKKTIWSETILPTSVIDSDYLSNFENTENYPNNMFMLMIQSYIYLRPMVENAFTKISMKHLIKSFEKITSAKVQKNFATMEYGLSKLKKFTQLKGNMIYSTICNFTNIRLNNVHKSFDMKEKVRAYLQRKDITCNAKNKYGHYIVSVCKFVRPFQIFFDHTIDDVCYEYLPIKTKEGELLFADEDKYLHHYSSSRKCYNIVQNGKIKKTIRYGENETLYEKFVDWVLTKLHINFRTFKIGWWSFNFLKIAKYLLPIYAAVFVLLICSLILFIQTNCVEMRIVISMLRTGFVNVCKVFDRILIPIFVFPWTLSKYFLKLYSKKKNKNKEYNFDEIEMM